MKRLTERLRKTPHLFAKAVIVYCILCATLACAYCLRAQARGAGMDAVLAVTLGFFGGELLLLCLKTILKKEDKGCEDPFDESDV